MSTIKCFEDLKIWQLARELNQELFEVLIANKEIRDYPLKDQINRSAGSIMDNIAEGFERGGNKEFRQFLSVARASCGETKSQLYRAEDRKYISKEYAITARNKAEQIIKMINGLNKYLNSSELKGIKFKNDDLNN